jgi:outer membrane protein OmpA-like peptidoglycan-associated protein
MRWLPAMAVGLGLVIAAAGVAGCAHLYKKPRSEPRPTTTAQGREIRGGEPSTPAVPAPVTAWTYSEAPAVPSGMEVKKLLKTLTFPQGSSTLNQEAKGALIEAARELKTNTRWHVLAAGFTDNRGEAGNATALSRARAVAAQKYLVSQGIAADRISTEAMGSKYAEGGEFEPGQVARDRRVEIWVFM